MGKSMREVHECFKRKTLLKVRTLSTVAMAILASSHAVLAATQSAFPSFPVPSQIYTALWPSAYDQQVALETLSGIDAYQTRIRGSGTMIWINQDNSTYDQWLGMYENRYDVPMSPSTNFWSLANTLHQKGILRGYVLYSAPAAGADGTYAGSDSSVNIATSLCAPLGAIAIDQSMVPEAQALGLRELANAEGQTTSWLLGEMETHYSYSHQILGLLSPQQTNCRDELVASGAIVVQSGSGGGLSQALPLMSPGGYVVGWDNNEENVVSSSSQYGMRVVAADWSSNLPLLSSGNTGLSYPLNSAPPSPPIIHDNGESHYVAFMNTDGDNLEWAINGYISGTSMWSDPNRGSIPFGWTLPLQNLMNVNPYEISYLRSTATANDNLVQFGNGYFYLDQFGSKAGGSALLDTILKQQQPYMAAMGIDTMIGFTVNWDSAAAQKAYQQIAKDLPNLKALYVIQYAPYAAGQGKVLLIPRSSGTPLPVISALTSIWAGGNNAYQGDPAYVATQLNNWAASSSAEADGSGQFAWVPVHEEDTFTEPGPNGTTVSVSQYDAAAYTAAHLDSNIVVVTPSQLASLMLDTIVYPTPGANDMIHDGSFTQGDWFTGNGGIASEAGTTPEGSNFAGEDNISAGTVAGAADVRSWASDPQHFQLTNGKYVNVAGRQATISWDWEWSGIQINKPLPAGAPAIGVSVQLRFFSLPPDMNHNSAGTLISSFSSPEVTGTSLGFVLGRGTTGGFIHEVYNITIPIDAQSMDFVIGGNSWTDAAGNVYYVDAGQFYVANVDVQVLGFTEPVPEPPTLAVMGCSTAGVLLLARRRSRSSLS